MQQKENGQEQVQKHQQPQELQHHQCLTVQADLIELNYLP